jgi:O-antigen ligase
MKKLLYILFALLLLAPITGELWRLPVLGFEFLPSDLIIPPLFVLWVLDKIKNDRRLRIGKIGKWVIFFLFVLFITYLLNALRFDSSQMLTAFSYMGRFGMYLVLALMVYDLSIRDKTNLFQKTLFGGMITSMILICLLGFLQLVYFPNFLELGMYLQGWDPHIGRLLSTWLDPNFIGGYLAFILGITISLGLYYRHHKNNKMFVVMGIISVLGLIALYMTFSRSGYLALVATLAVLAFFKSRKLLVAILLIMILAFSLSPRVQERTGEAWNSGKSLLGLNSQYALDPTAELRVWSWSFAREIIADHPIIGVGYGRYAYEVSSRGHGLMSDHSIGGSDSSLLTIWAQTGIVGLLSALLIGIAALFTSLKRIIGKNNYRSYFDAGILSSFCGVMIHSLFVNSLLYPLMMVYLWVGLGIMDEK